MKEAACNRMFLGVREQDVRARFRNQNMGGLEWIVRRSLRMRLLSQQY